MEGLIETLFGATLIVVSVYCANGRLALILSHLSIKGLHAERVVLRSLIDHEDADLVIRLG
jgi:hypothetical protein